ncbi:MAG: hypothetical protein J4G09_02635 [Proteobacteria bacterium]|nr:hypothetical protein [Pseudomonadota bacterium]
MRRSVALAACLALLGAGCSGISLPSPGSLLPWEWLEREEAPAEEVDVGVVADAEAAALARRVESFYSQLEGVSLTSELTYSRPGLPEYFASPEAYNDYFASLALQVRWEDLRHDQIERIEVREMRLADLDDATVEVVLFGRHVRRLRFWELELERSDRWRTIDGVWLLSPDNL